MRLSVGLSVRLVVRLFVRSFVRLVARLSSWLCCISLFFMMGSAVAGNPSIYFEVQSYPERIDSNCRDGIAKLYDECSDQSTLLNRAIDQGRKTGKTVLVVYGAEYCLWCHVFDKYVKGHSREFTYEWQYHDGNDKQWAMKETENVNANAEAKALNEFVAKNFIVVHIESYLAPNGAEAALETGFDADAFPFVPIVFSLKDTGKYAAHMLPYHAIAGLEVKTDGGQAYRGFDRTILTAELSKLLSAAQ